MQQQEALPTQPKGHTLFRKDARGLTQTQRVLIVLREALGTAGLSTCRSEVLAYQGAGKSEARTADASRHRHATRVSISSLDTHVRGGD